MSYYFCKTLNINFEEALLQVTQKLRENGFGVLTQINVQEVLKNKLDVDFRRYQILGACNPPFAYKALTLEDKIGLMMPCNVLLEEVGDNSVEVSIVDPLLSLQAVDNEKLKNEVLIEISKKLQNVINSL